MQDVSKIQCADCLHPDNRSLFAAIRRLMQRHGVVLNDLYLEEEIARQTPAFRPQGLCATCAMRKNCPDSAREGGIWHCKNYQ